MPPKRASIEADLHLNLTQSHDAKRKKTPLVEYVPENSREASSCSGSETSTLFSGPPTSDHTPRSSIASVDEEDGSGSGSGSGGSGSGDDSSDDDDTEDEEEDKEGSDADPVCTLSCTSRSADGDHTKPDIDPALIMAYAKDLRDRLHEFLPKLRKANDDIVQASAAHLNIEELAEGEQHIEMNLGLGVLEEQQQRTNSDIKLPSKKDQHDGHDPAESRDMGAVPDLLGLISPHSGRAAAPVKIEVVDSSAPTHTPR